MFKFFKRIRQQLLSENLPDRQTSSFSKYLLYATGEILLVVIGILIALQINNWNQNRHNQKLEVKYLSNLKEELSGNKNRTQRLIIDRFEAKMEGLQLAKAYAERAYTVQDTLDFLQKVAFGAVFSNGIEFLNTNTFDELISTGNLQLLENDSLKTSIYGHYRFIKSQKVNVRFYFSDYLKMINSQRVFKESNPTNISPYEQKAMLRKLKSETAFENINLEITYANRVITLIQGLQKRSVKLINAIEKELEILGSPKSPDFE